MLKGKFIKFNTGKRLISGRQWVRSSWTGYIFSASFISLAFLLRWFILMYVGDWPLVIVFIIPVLLSAYIGGLGPGLLAVALAGAGMGYFLRIPADLLAARTQWPYLAEWLIFLGSGIVGCLLVEALRRSRRQEKAAVAEVHKSERFLETIIENAPVCVKLVAADGSLLKMNRAGLAMIGADSLDRVKGKSIYALVSSGYREAFKDLTKRVFEGRPGMLEFEIVSLKGRRLLLNTHAVPLYNERREVVALLGITSDITESKRLEKEIMHMANHDELTGLPNRRFFMDVVAIELAQARRDKKKMAILFFDLDRFKEVNDTLGYEVGNELLKAVAQRLKKGIREPDIVARIGGDEFNILLTDIARAEDIATIVRKIMGSFQKPYRIAGYELPITTSIGISVYPDDGEEIDTLFRFADIAMYHAKDTGRNTFQFYNTDINVRSIERIKMEGYLRQSIDRGELTVHYQPQVDIGTGKITCTEALVRWNHPELGLLPPKWFIPVAEETGFITAIDEWVLRTACAQLKVWQEAGHPRLCVTVNLSARGFQNPGLVASIAEILDETGLSPDCLDIEITESTAMRDIERTIRQLNELAAMKVRISIDDFGTGYSSLSYLKRLPIQKLKIDQSFVKDIATDPDDRAIIKAVTAMAHNLKMTVVAEGVETEEQLVFLHNNQCDQAQGYLFDKPLPPEKFTEFITSGRSGSSW